MISFTVVVPVSLEAHTPPHSFSSMAASFLRIPVSPWWVTPLATKPRFKYPSDCKSLKVIIFGFSTSSSTAAASTTTTTVTPSEKEIKWEPFRKKKVVMRVGYVGSDYRGLFFCERNVFCFIDSSCTNTFSVMVCCVFFYLKDIVLVWWQVCKFREINLHYPVRFLHFSPFQIYLLLFCHFLLLLICEAFLLLVTLLVQWLVKKPKNGSIILFLLLSAVTSLFPSNNAGQVSLCQHTLCGFFC